MARDWENVTGIKVEILRVPLPGTFRMTTIVWRGAFPKTGATRDSNLFFQEVQPVRRRDRELA